MATGATTGMPIWLSYMVIVTTRRMAKGADDNSPEPCALKACPEPAEGSQARFGSGGGAGDCPTDHNWWAFYQRFE